MDGVVCAEPNYIIHPLSNEVKEKNNKTETTFDAVTGVNVFALSANDSVNDSKTKYQWYLDKINVSEAWDLVAGRTHSRVKVCVLDTGCSLNHKDLGINTWQSREYAKSSDGITYYWTLKGDDYHQGEKVSDKGHGTKVTGVLGALSNNSYGIAGIASCYNNDVLDIVAVDVFDKLGGINTIICGLYYAYDIDAKVVNMSLGMEPGYSSESLKIACNWLNDNGIVIVAAAGNENTTAYTEPSDIESVISVIATDENNNKWSKSSYGQNKDICAPGVNIYTTTDTSSFGSSTGTSLSAPMVTGTVAMMLSVNPDLTPDEVKYILYSTVTDLGNAGKDDIFGYGLLNAGKAVKKSIIYATGVYPVYGENYIQLGCIHEGGYEGKTKYRWECCEIGSSSWKLISNWNTSEWCTWYPDAGKSYAVVCKASYDGNGYSDSQITWYISNPQMKASLTGTCVMPSGNGILLGCTSNTNKYYTSLYIYSYATNSWIKSASAKGSACWYQATDLEKGTYMAYFCTEDTAYGRKLSTSYYNFTVN